MEFAQENLSNAAATTTTTTTATNRLH